MKHCSSDISSFYSEDVAISSKVLNKLYRILRVDVRVKMHELFLSPGKYGNMRAATKDAVETPACIAETCYSVTTILKVGQSLQWIFKILLEWLLWRSCYNLLIWSWQNVSCLAPWIYQSIIYTDRMLKTQMHSLDQNKR